ILAVALVILINFMSLSLPLLLLLVIQSSIWINMSIVDFRGVEIIFIGFLVIQTLQLGATIDYAVLLSSRYKEYRQTCHSMEAISKSLQSSGISVVISALVLALAGYAEGLLSNISAVREIGILIGRGALISGLLVILVLPSMLLAFDKLIMKTTYKANFLPKKEEI
ncbi:MAG: MMPL family transporter, partial [Bacilli bacterium]|nr:MMPL family transporter [Bacilli bacterium]